MTESKHTPGPWKYCGCGKCGLIHSIPAQMEVANTKVVDPDSPTPPMEEQVANGYLAAAAPELFEAGRNLLNACYSADKAEDLSDLVDGSLLLALHATINKAEGKE